MPTAPIGAKLVGEDAARDVGVEAGLFAAAPESDRVALGQQPQPDLRDARNKRQGAEQQRELHQEPATPAAPWALVPHVPPPHRRSPQPHHRGHGRLIRVFFSASWQLVERDLAVGPASDMDRRSEQELILPFATAEHRLGPRKA